MAESFDMSGLAEVLKRPCSTAAQPREYLSTISPVCFDPKLESLISNAPRFEKGRMLPKPIGPTGLQATTRGEMREAARALVDLESRSVAFRAPPGTGKSTMFPWELHRATTNMVVVLSPTELIAQAHALEVDEIGFMATYVNPVRMSVIPLEKTMGVVYTTMQGLIMRALAAKRDMTGLDTPMIVVHDESHLVDSDSHFFRTMWPEFSPVQKLVSVTAYVPEPERQGVTRTKGIEGNPDVVVLTAVLGDEASITPVDVDADGAPAPWSVEALKGKKTLMFLESDRIARYVVATYGKVMTARSLRRYDEITQYRRVRTALAEADPRGVLIVVDSTYQGGVKLAVDQIIDFGCVRHTVAGAGAQAVDQVVRETEVQQEARVHIAAPSVNAVRSEPVVAYVPNTVATNVAAGMGPGEVTKIASYCEMFGYTTPESAVPKFRGDLVGAADHVKFLKSGLPWSVWVSSSYAQRAEPTEVVVKPPDLPVGREERGLAVSEVLDWVGAQRQDIKPIRLLSGQSYADQQGSVAADPLIVEAIVNEFDDLYLWLRQRLKGPGVRLFPDFDEFERHAVWLIWLTAWNENVADLVALDKWRAAYGSVVAQWRERPDCKPKVTRLMSLARDIHDRWLLLSAWYQEMFRVHPYKLVEVAVTATLVDVRFAEFMKRLGHDVVTRHAFGVSFIDQSSTAAGRIRGGSDAGTTDEVVTSGALLDRSRFVRYGGYN